MTRYAALLRAINVGGHVVKMDVLRREFEALEFSNVATFIASGNVIFETGSRSESAVVTKIEKRLKQTLGYDVKTFLRTSDELAAAAAHEAFSAKDLTAPGASLFVGFLAAPPPGAIARVVESLGTTTDALHVNGREIYWLARKGFANSSLPPAKIERTLTVPVTMRNITTVRKLAERMR